MSWKSLLQRSYTPYSNIPKACIIESTSGKYYAGVRIENISYPLTIPALQAACSICLSEGEVPAVLYIPDQELEQLSYWVEEFELEVIETDTPPIDELKQLLHTQEDIIKEPLPRLQALLSDAVTPNSDFPVSALLFTNQGFFEGVNVEVSEWTRGLCAERVTLCKALAAGITEFTKMEVHTRDGEVSSPCGACRQVIIEHLPFHTMMLHHADGTLSEHLTHDLLPFSFKSEALKKH